MDSVGALVERVIDDVWYPAIVIDLVDQNFFNIIYVDDGRKEEGVERAELRKMETDGLPINDAQGEGLKPGMRVEREIDGVWFPAIVVGSPPPTPKDEELLDSVLTNENADAAMPGLVNLVYLDDGNSEDNVPLHEVRLAGGLEAVETEPVNLKQWDMKPSMKEIEDIRRMLDALPRLKKREQGTNNRRYSTGGISQLSPLLEVEENSDAETGDEGGGSKSGSAKDKETSSVSGGSRDSRKTLPQRSKSFVEPAVLLRKQCKQGVFSPDFAPLAGLCSFPNCKKMTPYRCNRCRTTFFCSRSHQRQQWKTHAPTCWPYVPPTSFGWTEEESAPKDGSEVKPWLAAGKDNGEFRGNRPRDYFDKSEDDVEPGFKTPEKKRDNSQKAVLFAMGDDGYERGVWSGDKQSGQGGLDNTHSGEGVYDADSDEQAAGQGGGSSGNKRQAVTSAESNPSYAAAAKSAKVGPAYNTYGNDDPKEEAIDNLQQLGFARELAMKALFMYQNNVERAAEWLFSQMGDGSESFDMPIGPQPRPRHYSSSEQTDDARVYPAPDDLRGLRIDTGTNQDDDMVTHINEAPTLEDDRGEVGPFDGTDLCPSVPPQRPSSPTMDDDQIPDLIPMDQEADPDSDCTLIHSMQKTIGTQEVFIRVFNQNMTGSYDEVDWNPDGLAMRIVLTPQGEDVRCEHVLAVPQPDIVCICKIHYSPALLDPSQEALRAITFVDLIEEIPPIFNARNRDSSKQECQGFQLISPSAGDRIIARSSPREIGSSGDAAGMETRNEIPDDGIELLEGQWRCTVCTFINESMGMSAVCQACGQHTRPYGAQTSSQETRRGTAMPTAVCTCDDFEKMGLCKHIPTIDEAVSYGVQEDLYQKLV
mmetsp:Transcript_18168/g.23911  ORF Transcript_18168/g.23911 Transcript_18168/m.23911 type:complete len:871 (+) Transcript_18168:95-2707(+)|eukprot:CAMPEP_0117740888 /NCGR_PEP_ID=MMETSP0947-20121206/4598_1 /TAXON_ID=44440 /ORGANISM="Chattonella subsalsa, Strain CCMP2191" /LENGTH=870 /DNA_ID=CAMNT_0005557065 /DNA_START=75 /DNA_END=2687 /DNA_ORIENTATION=-